MFSASSNNIIRTQGNAKTAMFIMLIGAIFNILFDYILMVIFKFGMAGSAYATVISQFLSFLLSFYYFTYGKSTLKINLKQIIPDAKIIKKIISIGFASFTRQSSMSLIGIVMNNSLKIYGGDLAIAAYGISFKLMMLLIMPAMGIVQGTQPIIGYNFGAKKYNRVKETLKVAIISSTSIILIMYFIIMFSPEIFIKLFTSDTKLIDITINIVRIMFILMPFIGFQFIVGGFFQSIEKAKSALIVSLLRQFIFLLPLLLILPLILGLNGVWWSYPISDFLSLIVTIIIFKNEYKKLE